MNELDILNHICNLRAEKGISQETLSDEVGISLRTYQRIESGNGNIKTSYLIDILAYLDPNFKNYFLRYFNNDSFFQKHLETPLDMVDILKTKNSIHQPMVENNSFDMELLKTALTVKNTQTIGYWEWNLESSSIYWSDEMYEIYSHKKGEPISYEIITQKIRPSDVKVMDEALELLFTKGTPLHTKHQVTHPNNGTLSVISTARKVKKNDQNLVFGINQVLDGIVD